MEASQIKDDQYYVNGLLFGDSQVLDQIYRQFHPTIKRLVVQNGGTPDDAYDVMQSVLVVVFQRLRKNDFELKGSFGGLLYGVGRNIWGNRMQKKSFQEVSLPEEAKYIHVEEWQRLTEEEEKRKLLRDKLNQLGEDCQKVLRLFFSGWRMDAIQREMRWSSTSYASKRKFQCKEQLVNLVQGDPRFTELKEK